MKLSDWFRARSLQEILMIVVIVHYDTPSSIRVWLIMPMLYPLPALKKPKNRPVLQGESRERKNGFQYLTTF